MRRRPRKRRGSTAGSHKGAVKTAKYEGQGFANNDPDISFSLTGENGDRAQLRFSRHDKELLAVTFNAGMKDMDVAEQEAEDFAKRAEEYLRQHPTHKPMKSNRLD